MRQSCDALTAHSLCLFSPLAAAAAAIAGAEAQALPVGVHRAHLAAAVLGAVAAAAVAVVAVAHLPLVARSQTAGLQPNSHRHPSPLLPSLRRPKLLHHLLEQASQLVDHLLHQLMPEGK